MCENGNRNRDLETRRQDHFYHQTKEVNSFHIAVKLFELCNVHNFSIDSPGKWTLPQGEVSDIPEITRHLSSHSNRIPLKDVKRDKKALQTAWRGASKIEHAEKMKPVFKSKQNYNLEFLKNWFVNDFNELNFFDFLLVARIYFRFTDSELFCSFPFE